jgi:hypothetical protein
MGELMATIKTIAIGDTLSLDLHDDADVLYVSIRRKDGGLVRVELAEVRHLVNALSDAGGELAARAVGKFGDERLS